MMPTFNEAATLSKIVQKTLRVPYLIELIIVDDYLTYTTPLITQKLTEQDSRIKYIRQKQNLGKTAVRVIYFYHYLTNKGLTFLSNSLTNLNMTDIETCYKAFRGEIIRNMTITSKGFGFEVEVTAKIAKLKCAVYEVPISYYGRTYEEGGKFNLKMVWRLFGIFSNII